MSSRQPTWSGRRAQDALRRVRADGARHDKPCCLCTEPIDYRLRYPDPMSCSVQHIKSRSLHPELTWEPSNWSPAHLRCNQEAGIGQPRPTSEVSIGVTSGW